HSKTLARLRVPALISPAKRRGLPRREFHSFAAFLARNFFEKRLHPPPSHYTVTRSIGPAMRDGQIVGDDDLHSVKVGYPSGQRGQTVNLLAYAFTGSNPV